MPEIWGTTKVFTAQIASGAGTSNAFSMVGYGSIGLFVPVITSAYIGFSVAPTGSPGVAGVSTDTDGPYVNLVDKAGNNISAITLGGTGNCALSSDQLTGLEGYCGPVKISASVAQTALRTFWVHLKGI